MCFIGILRQQGKVLICIRRLLCSLTCQLRWFHDIYEANKFEQSLFSLNKNSRNTTMQVKFICLINIVNQKKALLKYSFTRSDILYSLLC
jgi:hypothetical protein